MPRPLVSIVIPAYNAAATIGDTLRSIQNCGIEDREIVVVDDGSADDLATALSGLPLGDCSVLRLRRNSGISVALNVGIAAARGLYIARLDADDLIVDRRLERQVRFLERESAVAFCGTYRRNFGVHDDVISYPQSPDECTAALSWHHAFCHPAVTIHRERAEAHLYYDPRLVVCEDLDLWTRLVAAGALGANLPFVGLEYRMSAHQFTADAARSKLFNQHELAIATRHVAGLLATTVPMGAMLIAAILRVRGLAAQHPQFRSAALALLESSQPREQYRRAWDLVVAKARARLGDASAPSVSQEGLPAFTRFIAARLGRYIAHGSP